MKTKTDKEEELERIKAQYSPEFEDMVCDLFESCFTRGEIGEIMLREIAKISKDWYEK
jgi:hypothetical protein